MNRRRRDGRERGYVLIEALAALVLSGLVLAAVPVASGMLIRNWQKATAGSDTLDRLATGLSVVRRELSVLQRARWTDDRGRRRDEPFAFLGQPETLGMVLSADGLRLGPGESRGDRIVMFTSQPDQAGSTLLRGAIPFRPGLSGFEQIQLENPVILLQGPWRYKFFYGTSNQGRLEWLDTWEKEEELPKAIRLDVLNFATGQRVVPPMVVPIRVNTDPGCIDGAAGPCSG